MIMFGDKPSIESKKQQCVHLDFKEDTTMKYIKNILLSIMNNYMKGIGEWVCDGMN